MNEVIHNNSCVGLLRLPNNIHSARIIEIEVVHQAAPPRRHTVWPAESHVTYKGMSTAVEVTSVEVTAQSILLLNEIVRKVAERKTYMNIPWPNRPQNMQSGYHPT